MHRVTHVPALALISLAALPLTGALVGCEWLGTAGTALDTGGAVAAHPEDAAALIEGAIAEELQCHGTLRPGTIERMRDALHGGEDGLPLQELQALATAPEDLASVLALAGPKVELAFVVARNLAFLADEASVLRAGADGFTCDEDVALACTAGTQTTRVSCDEDGAPTAIDVSFDRCALTGKVLDGAALITRVADDAGAAHIAFAGLALDDTDVLQGALVVRIDGDLDDPDAFAASMRADDGFKLVTHGGPASGLRCGEELALDVVAFDLHEQGGLIELDGEQRDDSQTARLRTKGAHLSFAADGACGCPVPGSTLEVQVPRPLGEAGDEAWLSVAWGEAAGDACATVDVRALQWPATCYGLEHAGADCGRDAAVATTQRLLQALCG